MKLLMSVSLYLITCCGLAQVNVSSGLTIYDNGVIEEIERVVSVDAAISDLTIMTLGTNTTDFDSYIITNRVSIKQNDKYIYTLFDCVKPDNTQPTQFKFNYIDETLDNIQIISSNDTVARMIVSEL